MPLDKRSTYWLATLVAGSVLVLSCVPAKVAELVPTTAGTNTAVPVIGSNLPASAGNVGQTPSAAVQVVVPAGAVIKLQKALRTQAAGANGDFRATDLQKLVIQLDGRTLSPTEYTIGTPTYDDQGQLVLTIAFTPPPAKPTTIRVATADGGVTLMGQTSANGEPSRIDSVTTADALMAQLLVQPQTDEERPLCRQAIAKTVTDLLTSSVKRPLSADADLLGLMQRLSTFIASGRPLSQTVLAQIVTPPPLSAGGASCFTVTQIAPPPPGSAPAEGSTPNVSGGPIQDDPRGSDFVNNAGDVNFGGSNLFNPTHDANVPSGSTGGDSNTSGGGDPGAGGTPGGNAGGAGGGCR